MGLREQVAAGVAHRVPLERPRRSGAERLHIKVRAIHQQRTVGHERTPSEPDGQPCIREAPRCDRLPRSQQFRGDVRLVHVHVVVAAVAGAGPPAGPDGERACAGMPSPPTGRVSGSCHTHLPQGLSHGCHAPTWADESCGRAAPKRTVEAERGLPYKRTRREAHREAL